MDVEHDNRAKFDQLRVLAQNMLQLMASILINDCLRLQLTDQLVTSPSQEKLIVGDLARLIGEAAAALMSNESVSYVPELVRLYGEQSKIARRRKEQLQRIVWYRNRDAHTASLAQSNIWLDELQTDVDDVLESLAFLHSYIMVAATNVEITPDRQGSQLNGVRCQGLSDKYIPIRIPVDQVVSSSEVVLTRVDGGDCLSLRPWFLFLDSDGTGGSMGRELTLLNRVDGRRLDFVGLISGLEYRPDITWLMHSVYNGWLTQPTVGQDDFEDVEQHRTVSIPGSEAQELVRPYGALEDSVRHLLQGLMEACEGIVIQGDNRSHSSDSLILVRTSIREVVLATIDGAGTVFIHPRMLERAVADGLIADHQLRESIGHLDSTSVEQISRGIALLNVGTLAERSEWLCSLAHKFSI